MKLPSSASRALLERIFDQLDYARLASIYCDEGGMAFWHQHREPALRLGLAWARALGARLGASRGRSLYVGAGVAELPALVIEVLDLGREVAVASLNAAECAVINECLEANNLHDRLSFCHTDAAQTTWPDYDHLSLVSVLNDPGLYPTVSGMSYGRIPPAQFDVASFTTERDRLRELVDRLLLGLASPAVITTTFEEVAWLLDAAPRLGLCITADDETIETAIVGDPIGFLRVFRPED